MQNCYLQWSQQNVIMRHCRKLKPLTLKKEFCCIIIWNIFRKEETSLEAKTSRRMETLHLIYYYFFYFWQSYKLINLIKEMKSFPYWNNHTKPAGGFNLQISLIESWSGYFLSQSQIIATINWNDLRWSWENFMTRISKKDLIKKILVCSGGRIFLLKVERGVF